MNIVLRADAGIEIGNGHIMRSLTLAKALNNQGHRVLFICKQHPGHLCHLLEAQGIEVHSIPISEDQPEHLLAHSRWLGGSQKQDAQATRNIIEESFGQQVDWLIVDHYGIDYHWQKALTRHAQNIMVIDDLADRQHYCDLLLDQTLGRIPQDYQPYLMKPCTMLLGTEYALLRPEFNQHSPTEIIQHRQSRIKQGLSRLLIMMGGTDPCDITSQILASLNLEEFTKVTVVLGSSALNIPRIQQLYKQHQQIELKINCNQIAQLIHSHDICIGAAGSSCWERCSMGLVSLITVFAENQKLIAEKLVSRKIAVELKSPLNPDSLTAQIAKITDPRFYLESVKLGLDSCDGVGTSRVVEILGNG
ncbi:UDP-2,4-diacetamido-2,4,6-trideoxy-beta-L-altropyranose hydrolase [Dongshaea marina]|uniref:UDP-2,4-diacetamido-2,4, 6-trideoxy-beta-L-altropyranose hydrolase n=1 Tax=Dongshaea marina TaxID=2047966 RepID=UPI000D3E3DBB|nr:UDP-2,4-diacetamido-2,4,6-trideoxy-beta-L-altropyranose hydrolase [Dongshaea marina]